MLAAVFLIVAVILFILAAVWPSAPGQLIPIGLAFFAGSFLVGALALA